jgi:hypothetical protein
LDDETQRPEKALAFPGLCHTQMGFSGNRSAATHALSTVVAEIAVAVPHGD